MSETQCNSRDQFVVPVSRNRIRKIGGGDPREASTVPLLTKSSSANEIPSATPASSTQSIASDYGSLTALSTALSVSNASLIVEFATKSAPQQQQQCSTSAKTIDGRPKVPTKQRKARSLNNAIVILNRNTAVISFQFSSFLHNYHFHLKQ